MLSGCDIWSDKPGVPYEISVSSFDLVTTQDQGTSSNNINEVWVYTESAVLLGHVTKGKIVVDEKHFGFCSELRAYYENGFEEALDL